MKYVSDSRPHITVICIIAAAALAVLASVVSAFSAIEVNRSDNDRPLYDFSAGWENENGVIMSVNGMIEAAGDLPPDKPLITRKPVKGVDSGEMLFIHSRNLVINVYADGEPLYITAEDGNAGGMEGFDNYIFVGLPTEENADNLELHIYFTKYSVQSGIGSMLVGSEKDVVKRLLGENLIPVIIGVVFVVLGVCLIIFGFFTRNKVESYLGSVYFGIFLIMISLGIMFDSSWAHIVSGNVAYAETSQRIFLSAALPAFLAFIDSFFVTEHVYPVKILKLLSVAVFGVMLLLNGLGVVTIIGMGVYFLLFVVFCGIVVFEELLIFMIKTRGTKALRKQRDYFSVFFYILCCCMDILSFMQFGVGNDDLFFTRLGIIVMCAVFMVSMLGEIFTMVRLGVQAGRIGKIAFTDANTGIGNVAAFKSEFEDLESKKYGCKYIGIVQFDVNNLKVINDSRGHEAGDLLIKTAADIINKSFGTVGNCYRTGGDEFVALINDDHAPIVCEEAIYNFNRLIDKFNAKEDKPFDLRIAYGIAYYQNDKTADSTLKEIHKIADERMYENKKMLKARYARSPEEAIIR